MSYTVCRHLSDKAWQAKERLCGLLVCGLSTTDSVVFGQATTRIGDNRINDNTSAAARSMFIY